MSRAAERFDVTIVGAGPIGVVLGRLLGGQGIRTLIVDREPDVMKIPRAIALDDDGGRVLQAIGALSEVRRTMPRIEKVRLRSPDVGDVLVLDSNLWRNGNPMVLVFRQPELESTLRAGLAALPTVELRTSTTLESMEVGDESVSLALDGPDGPCRVESRYVVGCDGARSTVRKLVGLELVGSTYERDWLVVDVRRDPTPNREVHFLCDPRRPGVTMPAPEGGRRWEFMLGDEDDRASITSRETLRRLLAPWGDVDAMEVERAAVYTFHARVADHFRRGRVFLAGDAAHLTPPFAGQGLMAGLRDASNLAWKLAAVVRGEADARLLDTYEVERKPNARLMVDFARVMGSLIMPREGWKCFLRDRAFRPVARLPGLRDALGSLDVKPRTRIDAGLLRRDDRRGSLRAGDLLPQCAMETSTGHVAALDDLLGYRFAVVGVEVDPSRHLRRDQQRWLAELGPVLRVGSRSEAESSGCQALVDVERVFLESVPSGSCLVARPDKHLYAVVDAAELEQAVDALRRDLGASAAPRPEPRSLRDTSARTELRRSARV